MVVLPITDQAITQAVEILLRGGIVCHPTETCYGLACDLTNLEAVEKLFALKKRPTTEPVSALFSSVEDAKKYVLWNPLAEELAKKYLPGPLTIVLPLKMDTPHVLFPIPLQATSYPSDSAEAGKLQAGIGIRISSHPVAMELARRARIPLSTTSANVHGYPPPYSVADLKVHPDLILDGGILPKATPSTVVLVKDGVVKVLREGSIPSEKLQATS